VIILFWARKVNRLLNKSTITLNGAVQTPAATLSAFKSTVEHPWNILLSRLNSLGLYQVRDTESPFLIRENNNETRHMGAARYVGNSTFTLGKKNYEREHFSTRYEDRSPFPIVP
jgi:hypothetical protein